MKYFVYNRLGSSVCHILFNNNWNNQVVVNDFSSETGYHEATFNMTVSIKVDDIFICFDNASFDISLYMKLMTWTVKAICLLFLTNYIRDANSTFALR